MIEKERARGIYKTTLVGSAVNIVLVILKFIAGVVGHSSAMIADAAHSLSDLITDAVIIIFVKISNKPKDKKHDYGYGKFETFSTLLVGFVLLIVGLGIAWSGISSILHVFNGGTLEKPGMIALWGAIITIVSKEILYHYTIIQARKLKSDALTANAWHHRSDGLTSIATAIGVGGAIFLGTKWTILDPLAAMFVSVFIIIMALKLMKPALEELMERSLPEETENEIIAIAKQFEDVHDLHHLCTRKIGTNYAIEFHVRMDGNMSLSDAHSKITEIERRLKERYGENTHVIIHPEPEK
ncbi:MAG: cation diffusion facilitator family transporter [Bacteroidales bacterium]|jgi:cation diffusion facilitator family transporter|nr:cation diffusion facilitator family transporter [Bacteroidales bacterium]